MLETVIAKLERSKPLVLMADRAGCFHGRKLPFYIQQHHQRLGVEKLFFGESGYNKSDLDAAFAKIGAAIRALSRFTLQAIDTPKKLFAALEQALGKGNQL